MLVSTPDRHLVFFGTETTIGDKSTQDDMFIRFSAVEDINTYTPTATNELVHRDWPTDHGSWERLEVEMQSMFTQIQLYSYKDLLVNLLHLPSYKVGTNCGLAGKNAAVEVDGAAYWMSENGFFKYAGALETLPCLVEDFVYDDINLDSGNQMIISRT